MSNETRICKLGNCVIVAKDQVANIKEVKTYIEESCASLCVDANVGTLCVLSYARTVAMGQNQLRQKLVSDLNCDDHGSSLYVLGTAKKDFGRFKAGDLILTPEVLEISTTDSPDCFIVSTRGAIGDSEEFNVDFEIEMTPLS
jgi:hypothetical protein